MSGEEGWEGRQEGRTSEGGLTFNGRVQALAPLAIKFREREWAIKREAEIEAQKMTCQDCGQKMWRGDYYSHYKYEHLPAFKRKQAFEAYMKVSPKVTEAMPMLEVC